MTTKGETDFMTATTTKKKRGRPAGAKAKTIGKKTTTYSLTLKTGENNMAWIKVPTNPIDAFELGRAVGSYNLK